MSFFILIILSGAIMANIHPGFVSISEICPSLKIQASYSSGNNFTGGKLPGYKSKKAFMAKIPARALCEVNSLARSKGLGLKIFDAYRPVKAVNYFWNWAQMPEDNPELKILYYPSFTRNELFEKGFIAKKSSHSRGSAVDLTLFDLKSGMDLDMGTGFDYFDEKSHTESPLITENQLSNRRLLRELMGSKNFKNFSQEWWHFSYRPEPYPNQYFDFDIE